MSALVGGEVNRSPAGQLIAQNNGDMAPTPAMRAAFAAVCRNFTAALAGRERVITADLTAFNGVLARNGMPAVAAPGKGKTRVRC